MTFPARLKEYVETSSDASGFPVSLTSRQLADAARYRISPGMSCTITMWSADPVPDAVSLPVSAVYAPAQGGEYVWMVGAGDTVMRRQRALGELSAATGWSSTAASCPANGSSWRAFTSCRRASGERYRHLKLTPP